MNKLSATLKGLITGIVMVLISILIFVAEGNFENNLQYITYSVYVGGILWTLMAFHNNATETRKFRSYFSEGFKCFVVVTLLMVLFTFIFMKLNPQLKEEMAKQSRLNLVNKGNYTPAEIDQRVEMARKYFVTMLISMAIFGYIIIGSLLTAIIGAILIRNKKTVNQA